jgi:hypothetical protein
LTSRLFLILCYCDRHGLYAGSSADIRKCRATRHQHCILCRTVSATSGSTPSECPRRRILCCSAPELSPARKSTRCCAHIGQVRVEGHRMSLILGWIFHMGDRLAVTQLRHCSSIHIKGSYLSELLKDLTRTFRLSPAFLVGHAGSDLSPRTLWPICPPLPSQRSNMGHVRFLTLGQGYIRKCYNRTTGIQPEGRFDFSGMPALREKYRRNTERLNFGPMSNLQVGDTGVRDVHFHDRRYFSVEQVVSFCFVRDGQKDSWVGKSASE